MVHTAYFKQVLLSLGINTPFSLRELHHQSLLKKESSIALFYNVYDISILTALFDSAKVSLKLKVYFHQNEEVPAPASDLTAKEKVALAQQCTGTCWRADNVNSAKPTSRHQLKGEEIGLVPGNFSSFGGRMFSLSETLDIFLCILDFMLSTSNLPIDAN